MLTGSFLYLFFDEDFPKFEIIGSGTGIELLPNSRYINIEFERSKIISLIDELGADKAYFELKKQLGECCTGDQHAIVHIFGEFLYKKVGIEGGFKVCDKSFLYACFHGFLVSAVSDRGMDAVRLLDRACLDAFDFEYVGCQHGIGHGLVEFLGSSKKALDTVIKICEEMTTHREDLRSTGCVSGAIMEYRSPFLISVKRSIFSRIEYFNVDDVLVSTKEIRIKRYCRPENVVVGTSSFVRFYNDSEDSIMIGFKNGLSFSLEPSDNRLVNLDDWIPGVYEYYCGNEHNLVGIVKISE